MNNKDYFHLGKFSKPHGVKGEITIVFDSGDSSEYLKLQSLFADIHGSLVPFFLTSVRPKGRDVVVAIEGFDDSTSVRELEGRDIYLPIAQLPKLKEGDYYLHDLVGMTVIDKNHGEIGKVVSILDMPTQHLMQVEKDRVEILIPVQDHIIRQVNLSEKTVSIEAPEGLIDIYLGKSDEDEERY